MPRLLFEYIDLFNIFQLSTKMENTRDFFLVLLFPTDQIIRDYSSSRIMEMSKRLGSNKYLEEMYQILFPEMQKPKPRLRPASLTMLPPSPVPELSYSQPQPPTPTPTPQQMPTPERTANSKDKRPYFLHTDDTIKSLGIPMKDVLKIEFTEKESESSTTRPILYAIKTGGSWMVHYLQSRDVFEPWLLKYPNRVVVILDISQGNATTAQYNPPLITWYPNNDQKGFRVIKFWYDLVLKQFNATDANNESHEKLVNYLKKFE